MGIQEDVLFKLAELSDLFSISSKIKVLHIHSTRGEPLSYYFVSIDIDDLGIKKTYLKDKSFLEIMLDILKEKHGDARQIELEYLRTIDKLEDYRPVDMCILEEILLNPYEPGEDDETRSLYAYKHYVRNCFYDWLHCVDWKERTDVIKVNDVSFTPKKSLITLLQANGFPKDIIPHVHILRCVRQPIGRTIHYVGA